MPIEYCGYLGGFLHYHIKHVTIILTNLGVHATRHDVLCELATLWKTTHSVFLGMKTKFVSAWSYSRCSFTKPLELKLEIAAFCIPSSMVLSRPFHWGGWNTLAFHSSNSSFQDITSLHPPLPRYRYLNFSPVAHRPPKAHGLKS